MKTAVVLAMLMMFSICPHVAVAGMIHAYATAQIPEFGTTAGITRNDQAGEFSATASAHQGADRANAFASLRSDNSLRLAIEGGGDGDGYGVSAGWRDTFFLEDPSISEVFFEVAVHATYNVEHDFLFFGLGRSAPGFRNFDLSIASANPVGDILRRSEWAKVDAFTSTSFSGVARFSESVIDGEAELSVFFTATQSTSLFGSFNGLNTATLLRVTDQNGNEVLGSFASGMIPQSSVVQSSPVPEPSSAAYLWSGFVIGGILVVLSGTRVTETRDTVSF